MSQAPNSGTLEEVLRFMKSMFGTAAFTNELDNITAQIATSQTYNITDINGATYPIDTKDTFSTDESWVLQNFAKIVVTDGLKVGADNPTLLLFGQPGTVAKALEGGDFRLDQNFEPSYDYIIDGAVVTYGTDPEATQREATMLADACDRLVIRNPYLGGLVQYIESVGPPTPASVPKAGGTYGGALIRWHAQVKRII